MCNLYIFIEFITEYITEIKEQSAPSPQELTSFLNGKESLKLEIPQVPTNFFFQQNISGACLC